MFIDDYLYTPVSIKDIQFDGRRGEKEGIIPQKPSRSMASLRQHFRKKGQVLHKLFCNTEEERLFYNSLHEASIILLYYQKKIEEMKIWNNIPHNHT